MKLLHVSDLHIGKRMNGISLVEDQRHILSQIVSLATDRQVDALLVAGDIYDKASPSAEAVTLFDAFLTELAHAGIRVLAIPGNHDSAERIAYAQGLLSDQGVSFPPVFSGSVQCVTLEDEHGPVAIWLMPYLKPWDVRRFFPDGNIGEDYSVALRSVLESCEVDRAMRNVMLSHQLVTAFGTSPDRADEEVKLGGIDNVDFSVYDDFDYVALGHVHRPQRVGRDTVRYSGSPLKYSFSEARYDKSAVLVELGSKAEGDAVGECVQFELVPLTPLHDMREVRASLRELLEEGAAGSAESEDYLHVTLTDEHAQLDAMSRIREVFPNAMSLDYDNITVFANREEPGIAVDPDKVDVAELFSGFYELQVGKPMDEAQVETVSRIVRSVQETHASGDGSVEGARK